MRRCEGCEGCEGCERYEGKEIECAGGIECGNIQPR
jgi:hypothetical protein